MTDKLSNEFSHGMAMADTRASWLEFRAKNKQSMLDLAQALGQSADDQVLSRRINEALQAASRYDDALVEAVATPDYLLTANLGSKLNTLCLSVADAVASLANSLEQSDLSPKHSPNKGPSTHGL